MAQEILTDAAFRTLFVQVSASFNNTRVTNVADGIILGDAVNYGQLSSFVSTYGGGGGGSGGGSEWSTYDALQNVNMDNYGFNNTGYLSLNSGADIYTLTYGSMSSISTTVGEDNCRLSDVSSIVSTLSEYCAIEAALNVQNIQRVSTISSTVMSIQAGGLPGQRQVGFSTINASSAPATGIVQNIISTNGHIVAFQNTTGLAVNLQLQLSTLGTWPNQKYDAMKFSHVGASGQANVLVYAETSAFPTSLLATMAPGDTKTFIWRGFADTGVTSSSSNYRALSNQYYILNGY
jgi:hypothetical protein